MTSGAQDAAARHSAHHVDHDAGLEQPRIFIALAERQRVTQMAKVLKVRPEPRAGGRARTAMSMFGVSGPKADGVYAELAKTYGVGSYLAARLLK